MKFGVEQMATFRKSGEINVVLFGSKDGVPSHGAIQGCG